LDKM